MSSLGPTYSYSNLAPESSQSWSQVFSFLSIFILEPAPNLVFRTLRQTLGQKTACVGLLSSNCSLPMRFGKAHFALNNSLWERYVYRECKQTSECPSVY